MQGRSTWLRCVVIVMPALIGLRPATAQDSNLELAVKAAYLPKLAQFVVWPNDDTEFPGGVFPLCVIGPDPFGSLLDRAVAGQTVGGHPILVRRLQAAADPQTCSLAYFGGSSFAALAAMQGQPVLTVTDQASDPGRKGIINFIVQDKRVRFEIDDASAASNGLGISSKLLTLAVAVRARMP